MPSTFELGTTYNFNTLAPAILGSNVKNATVLGIIDYTTASNYITPETRHVDVYPYLPTGTVNDPKKYTYILFKSESNVKFVLGLPWIDLATVVQVVSLTINVTVNNASTGDANRIRDSLILLGFNSFTVTIA